MDEKSPLFRIRHSLAHIMAQAVQEMRPGTKLGFGPPIDDGFYYDFILPSPITEADFPELEKRMRKLLEANHKFVREELAPSDALARIDGMGEPYKREYAQELLAKKSLHTLSFYVTGAFQDMCDGPHVENTREIPKDAFKIRAVSGAYWRGDSKNQQMTRIYAWAFQTRAELDAHVKAFKLAQERDHKKLGKELELFAVDDVIGKGLPLWLPNGTVVRDELEKLMRDLEFKAGFQRVVTPALSREGLYYTTGHLPYYAPHMFPVMAIKDSSAEEDAATGHAPHHEAYRLKPMNCPHHHRIFATRLRSYRELPMRLAEYGTVYRFEDSGALSGLLRVRGMSMNDAHIYCTEEQIVPELQAVLAMHKEVYEILGLTQYHLRFSTWDPEDPKGREKYVDHPEAWEKCQKIVRGVLEKSGMPFVEGKGEAAFYGPKIDFQFRTVTGREETASTCQLDFAMPERMDLQYKGADNQMHRPYIIHRAPLGTHERFVAFLIEHYGGAFPTWLAPVQVRVIPVGEAFSAYGDKVVQTLRAQMIRAELDGATETLGKRLRSGVTQKIPNLLILGEREQVDQTVTLRRYGVEKQETLPLAQFMEWIETQIRERVRTL